MMTITAINSISIPNYDYADSGTPVPLSARMQAADVSQTDATVGDPPPFFDMPQELKAVYEWIVANKELNKTNQDEFMKTVMRKMSLCKKYSDNSPMYKTAADLTAAYALLETTFKAEVGDELADMFQRVRVCRIGIESCITDIMDSIMNPTEENGGKIAEY